MKKLNMTIVTPCFNEERRIEKYFKVLENQTIKPEVIIVDGGSTDKTIALVKKFIKTYKSAKLVIEKAKRSPGNARNIGWKKAKGDIIYFMDVDTVFEKNFVKKVIKEFEKHPKADLIRFKVSPYLPKNFKTPLEKALYYKDERGGARLIVFRTDAFGKRGIYADDLGFGEDRILYYEMMKHKILDTNVTVRLSKSARLDFAGIAQRYMWYGRTMVPYLQANKDLKVTLWLLLAISITFLIPFFWITSTLTFLFLILLLIPFLRGVFIGIKLLERYNVWTPVFMLPFIEVTASICIGLGFVRFILGDHTLGR